MEAPEAVQEASGNALPNNFRRALEATNVRYPGCEKDLASAREAIETGSKKDFLQAFRSLKGKQVAYEQRKGMKPSDNLTANELKYPGNESDKRKLQNWFQGNPPNEENLMIFKERIVGLQNKSAAARGDRSHPNIIALLNLKLSYPGCEADVQEALQIHYTRPYSQFPDKLQSLQAKQDSYKGDRTHWRLLTIDELELTYPKWKRDVEALEDWHIHHSENHENDVLFHEIVEGLLEKEALYLEWIHQRRKPRFEKAEVNRKNTLRGEETRDQRNTQREEDDDSVDDIYGKRWGKGSASFDKYYVQSREEYEGQEPEGREPTLENERF
jgi:hypothetical protein